MSTKKETVHRSWAEPYKIKMVEPIRMTTKGQRLKSLEKAGYNTFLLRSEDVYIDLLTDSGTSAMSDRQWAAIMMGDEAYAGSRNYYNLEEAVTRFYGYKYTLPTHQGRGAEHLISQILIKPNDIIPGNMYFTTTRLHQEIAGGTFIDVVIDEAHDPESLHPFKGNIDIGKLNDVIKKYGAKRIPYISVATSVNMAGGQPLSIANLKEIRKLTLRHGIKIVHDMTRVAENAYFIQQREPGYKSKPIAVIIREICALTDIATMSAKKDALVNIGGILAMNDEKIYSKAQNLAVVYEGLHTYGGLAGRDMEAMAVGISESVKDDHIRARIGQVEYLGHRIQEQGIPTVLPFGGHGIFLNAAKFLSHIPREKYPAQTLAAEIYKDSGVRSMERGVVSAGRDKAGKNIFPKLELVRLTIPRRVYTQAHMDVVAESVGSVFQNREQIKGLKMVYEPEYLRFFQAKFKQY